MCLRGKCFRLGLVIFLAGMTPEVLGTGPPASPASSSGISLFVRVGGLGIDQFLFEYTDAERGGWPWFYYCRGPGALSRWGLRGR